MTMDKPKLETVVEALTNIALMREDYYELCHAKDDAKAALSNTGETQGGDGPFEDRPIISGEGPAKGFISLNDPEKKYVPINTPGTPIEARPCSVSLLNTSVEPDGKASVSKTEEPGSIPGAGATPSQGNSKALDNDIDFLLNFVAKHETYSEIGDALKRVCTALQSTGGNKGDGVEALLGRVKRGIQVSLWEKEDGRWLCDLLDRIYGGIVTGTGPTPAAAIQSALSDDEKQGGIDA